MTRLDPSLQKALQGAPSAELEDESVFHSAWRTAMSTEMSPFEMAVLGGAHAQRFAFIFSAGYQAAIRHVFPEERIAGWAAFAVSEDRSEANALPGLTYGAEGTLSGWKTWIAASDYCSTLFVSAKGAEGVRYFRVDRDSEGLEIETRPKGRVLPDLSQGRAQFQACPARHVPETCVEQFGPAEALFIYTAFLASTWRRFAERRSQVESLLTAARKIAESQRAIAWEEPMRDFDAGVQLLLKQLRAQECAEDDLWRRDYKLIALYSKQR